MTTTRAFNYPRWLYGLAGGALAVTGLFALKWGQARILGPTPFAPLRDWWHSDGSHVSTQAWALFLVLFALLALHAGLALKRSQRKYDQSLLASSFISPKSRRYFQVFQNFSGVMIIPMLLLFGVSLISSEPDLADPLWHERYPTLSSYMIQLAILPLLVVHGVVGMCRLVWRWWPSNPASAFYRRPILAMCSYVMIVVFGGGIHQLYCSAFVA